MKKQTRIKTCIVVAGITSMVVFQNCSRTKFASDVQGAEILSELQQTSQLSETQSFNETQSQVKEESIAREVSTITETQIAKEESKYEESKVIEPKQTETKKEIAVVAQPQVQTPAVSQPVAQVPAQQPAAQQNVAHLAAKNSLNFRGCANNPYVPSNSKCVFVCNRYTGEGCQNFNPNVCAQEVQPGVFRIYSWSDGYRNVDVALPYSTQTSDKIISGGLVHEKVAADAPNVYMRTIVRLANHDSDCRSYRFFDPDLPRDAKTWYQAGDAPDMPNFVEHVIERYVSNFPGITFNY